MPLMACSTLRPVELSCSEPHCVDWCERSTWPVAVGVACAPATFEVAVPVALAPAEGDAAGVCEGRAVEVGEGGAAVGDGDAVAAGVTCCVVTVAPALVWPSAPCGC